MLFSGGAAFGSPKPGASESNRLVLTLWPITQDPLKSSIRSLSSFEKLNEVCVLALFTPTSIKVANDRKDLPSGFVESFLEEGFSEPINLKRGKGFAFILKGKKANMVARARAISILQVANSREVLFSDVCEMQHCLDVFPILSRFALRYPIVAPPNSATSFVPLQRREPNAVHKAVAQPQSKIQLQYSKAFKLEKWNADLTEVLPNLYVSSYNVAVDYARLLAKGITHIINLTNMEHESPGFEYMNRSMSDGGEENILSHLFPVAEFIDRARRYNGKILVHCIEGVSRSCSIVIGYLMLKEQLSYQDAYSIVRSKRRVASPHPRFIAQLMQLAEIIHATDSKTCIFSRKQEVRFVIKERYGALVADPLHKEEDYPTSDGSKIIEPVLLDDKCYVLYNFDAVKIACGSNAPAAEKDVAVSFARSLEHCLCTKSAYYLFPEWDEVPAAPETGTYCAFVGAKATLHIDDMDTTDDFEGLVYDCCAQNDIPIPSEIAIE